MSSSEPFVGAGDLQEDLGMFEAATHAAPIQLPEVSLTTVLLALDGSNQDNTARSVAARVAAACSAQVAEERGLITAQDIRAAKTTHRAELVVLPVPFGSDIGELREESLGVVMDQLLASCLPILAVRQPLEEAAVQSLFQRLHVPLSPVHESGPKALAWACRLLGPAGTLRVYEFADARLREEARTLGKEAEPAAAVGRVLSRFYAGTIAVLQRLAVEKGFQMRVASVSERFVKGTLAAVEQAAGLIVVAGATDRSSDAFHHAADLILGSRGPVLVV